MKGERCVAGYWSFRLFFLVPNDFEGLFQLGLFLFFLFWFKFSFLEACQVGHFFVDFGHELLHELRLQCALKNVEKATHIRIHLLQFYFRIKAWDTLFEPCLVSWDLVTKSAPFFVRCFRQYDLGFQVFYALGSLLTVAGKLLWLATALVSGLVLGYVGLGLNQNILVSFWILHLFGYSHW